MKHVRDRVRRGGNGAGNNARVALLYGAKKQAMWSCPHIGAPGAKARCNSTGEAILATQNLDNVGEDKKGLPSGAHDGASYGDCPCTLADSGAGDTEASNRRLRGRRVACEGQYGDRRQDDPFHGSLL